jgi:DNA-binding NarL/FixJ family response regulator
VSSLRDRLTNKEIAVRLNLSEQTVKNHVHRCCGRSEHKTEWLSSSAMNCPM